jgi:hypothetical protein
MLCSIFSAAAQTAENAFTISGGEFGKGVAFDFPADKPAADFLHIYKGGMDKDNKNMNVGVINTIIKNGKDLSVQMQFNMEAVGAGTYHFNTKTSSGVDIPPPYAGGIIRIGSDDINPPHVEAIPYTGTLTVTGVGAKGSLLRGVSRERLFR